MQQIKLRMKLTDYLLKFDIFSELVIISKTTPKRKQRAVAEIVRKNDSGNIYFSLRKNSGNQILIRLQQLSIKQEYLLSII
jgi:hypothetical protein